MGKNTTNVGRCLLGQILRNKKMSASELALKLNMSQSQISDYVRNRKSMSVKTTRRISRALSVKMDDLYDWDFEWVGVNWGSLHFPLHPTTLHSEQEADFRQSLLSLSYPYCCNMTVFVYICRKYIKLILFIYFWQI